jgi:hypothetical protein
LSRKTFFLTKENNDLVKLSKALKGQGYQKIIYICHSYHPCYSSKGGLDRLEFSVDGKNFNIEFSKIGEFDKPLLYQAVIVDSSKNTYGS